jgi:3-hydroxypropanoate dehydrogenase
LKFFKEFFQMNPTNHPVSDAALQQAFLSARTFNKFTDQPVTDAVLHQLYDLIKWGPTSMNCQPARYVFVRSSEAKQKLKGALAQGNRDKTMAAPITVIVAWDKKFFEQLPEQFPASAGARDMLANNQDLANRTGRFNSALQAAYVILGARLLGLDCGPMAGFDAAAVDAAFFPDGQCTTAVLINLGYGAPDGTYPRGPRLSFATVASII